MTDADRLAMIKRYAENMSPVFWDQALHPPEEMARRRGYDAAMREVQQDLLQMLSDHG